MQFLFLLALVLSTPARSDELFFSATMPPDTSAAFVVEHQAIATALPVEERGLLLATSRWQIPIRIRHRHIPQPTPAVRPAPKPTPLPPRHSIIEGRRPGGCG
ncbi:MAG: hypothetical protein R3E01_11620 [Pirellulaceae bacterium]